MDSYCAWKDPYWVLEVGDEPEDETVQGPFKTFREAMTRALFKTYYTCRLPKRMNNCNALYWSGQISGLYLVQQKHKPSYDLDLRNNH